MESFRREDKPQTTNRYPLRSTQANLRKLWTPGRGLLSSKVGECKGCILRCGRSEAAQDPESFKPDLAGLPYKMKSWEEWHWVKRDNRKKGEKAGLHENRGQSQEISKTKVSYFERCMKKEFGEARKAIPNSSPGSPRKPISLQMSKEESWCQSSYKVLRKTSKTTSL